MPCYNNNNNMNVKNHQTSKCVSVSPRLLDRRKRYLLFPESSSFQMIFDLIIGVVDYTKFAILGITCAVAWELPSKPPSEILEDVRQELLNGTLGLHRRNDTVDSLTTLVDSNVKEPKFSNYYYSQELSQPTWNSQQSWYKYPNPAIMRSPYIEYPHPQGNVHKIYKKPETPTIRYIYGKLNRRRRNRRQVDKLTEKLGMREHLISRDKLYGKIKSMYKRSGYNGTACVLRALCETGERNRRHAFNNASPQEFTMELLRAIFSLPSWNDILSGDLSTKFRKTRDVQFIGNHYLEAHHNTEKHCKQLYKHCEHSIWKHEIEKD